MTSMRFKIPYNVYKHYLNPLRRYLRSRSSYYSAYEPSSFFDQFHGLTESADSRVTISPDFPDLDARFHYNTVENGIIGWLKDEGFQPQSVLDIGSGNGHWLDFYRSVVLASELHGVDLSRVAVDKLRERFGAEPKVQIHHGTVTALDAELPAQVDLINAIGVLFHIVSDQEWEDTLRWCASRLKPGGLFVASGLMGLMTVNVQFEPVRFASMEEYRGNEVVQCNKRVRSARYWRAQLARCGFRRVEIRKSRCPASIQAPENNLLFALK